MRKFDITGKIKREEYQKFVKFTKPKGNAFLGRQLSTFLNAPWRSRRVNVLWIESLGSHCDLESSVVQWCGGIPRLLKSDGMEAEWL